MKGHNFGLCKKCGKTHINPFFGKNHTRESKLKISQSKKGKPPTLKQLEILEIGRTNWGGHNWGICNKCGKYHKHNYGIGTGRPRKYQTQICLICDKEFYKPHQIYCSIECRNNSKEWKQNIGNGNRGKPKKLSQETLERKRANCKENPRNKGRIFSESWRKNIGNGTRRNWQLENYRTSVIDGLYRFIEENPEKHMERQKKAGRESLRTRGRRPTSYEQKIIDLTKKYSLEFKYTGDGSNEIGGLYPDFTGYGLCENLLIETYESYFRYFEYSNPKEYEKERKYILEKLGYRVLFLNEADLLRKNWEQHCLTKINSFIREKNESLLCI